MKARLDKPAAVWTPKGILPAIRKRVALILQNAGRRVEPAELTTFDVFYQNGAWLRFQGTVEAKSKEAAEEMVRNRVPAQHRKHMEVLPHRVPGRPAT